MSARQVPRLTLPSVVICFCAALPQSGFTQSWVPPKGEGYFALSYSNLGTRDHLDAAGKKVDRGRIRGQTTLASFDYGLTSRLAVSGDVAHVFTKHNGLDRLHGPKDDGFWHGTLQDARIEFRYNLLRGSGVALTPFVGATIPTNSYNTLGHSAAGRNLHEVPFGLNAGGYLGPWLPKTFLQGRYSYAIVERVATMRLNRSHVDWDVGYIATERLALRFLGSMQRTHGGYRSAAEVPPAFWLVHDNLLRQHVFRLGGGASFALGGPMEFYGTYYKTIWGRTTHSTSGLTIGLAWNFGRSLGNFQDLFGQEEPKAPIPRR